MFKRKTKKVKELTLYQYQPTFITTDGVMHIGCMYKWANPNAVIHTIPDHIMISITSNGYMYDNNYNMYMLNNIVSIKWEKVDEITILDNFRHDYKVFFTYGEIIKRINKDKEKTNEN